MINNFLYKKPKLLENLLKTMSTFVLPETSENLFKIIFTEELSFLVNLFKENKFDIKIAGGAVRDILMGIFPHDIDFATDATPTDMKELFEKNKIRLINANGESHGTITPRINDKENFEITTLRIDKVTDGRRAEVIFTKDWKIDAERRDLTINSMFLDMDGVVHDFFNGKEDIDTRTVRFVGDPSQRIQEDYLRILRYFRFYGRISKTPDDHMTDTLMKIKEHSAGLQRVSGERIWMELRKTICGNFAPQILKTMKSCNIFLYIGLSEETDISEMQDKFPIMIQNNCHPAIIMSTLFNNKEDLSFALERLKFSKEDLVYMLFMVNNKVTLSQLLIDLKSEENILNFFKDKYIMHVGEPPQIKLKSCFIEYFKYMDRLDLLRNFEEWKPPIFPIRGDILSKKWNIKGKKLGSAMQFLKQKWKESNYDKVEDNFLNDNIRNEFMSLNN